VLLVMHDGWAAIEVQLARLDRRRLMATLTGYGTDERFGSLIFLIEDEQSAREIEDTAAAVGISQITSVQRMDWG
jgi:hypothetical protein